MQLGSERLIKITGEKIRNSSVGLLAHKASVDSSGTHIFQTLIKENIVPKVLLGPEHGFESIAQDMEAVATESNSLKAGKKIPIYSLYGKTFESLKPTQEMFDKLDYLIVDLQDIGSRYYTYIYTMAFCMQRAKETGTKVVVCDRPNPINGISVEGGLIEDGYNSFVGLYPLPNRHGMTIGELATLFNKEFGIGCNLEIVQMKDWERKFFWDDCGIEWANPSPNMRSLDAALLYPGGCLIEGTNASEGRGTEQPFMVCGAPYVDGHKLTGKLNDLKLPGIKFHPTTFTPTRQKWSGEKCEGVKFEIVDRKSFKPYLTGLALIQTLSIFAGFKWRTEEYEFVTEIPAIDLLTGSKQFRESIEKLSIDSLHELAQTPNSFLATRKKHLLY